MKILVQEAQVELTLAADQVAVAEGLAVILAEEQEEEINETSSLFTFHRTYLECSCSK